MEPGRETHVYHIVPASDLSACTFGGWYEPASLRAEGFVHCSGSPRQVLEVAAAFFAAVSDPVLVLRLEVARLSSRLVWEPASGVGGRALPDPSQGLFPHVYGPINLDAVSGVGALRKVAGVFAWPATWTNPEEYGHLASKDAS